MALIPVIGLVLIFIVTAVASFSARGHRVGIQRGKHDELLPRVETILCYKNLNEDRKGVHNSSNTTLHSREVSRELSVQPIRTMEDYNAQVIDEKEKLVIIRFHAPWCRVCKATNVAYERCAAKIQRMHPQKVKFLSINLDGRKKTNDLKELIFELHGINVDGVPMGMLYYPEGKGIVGKVRLNRKQLSVLKDRVETYLEEEGDLTSLFDELEIL